MKRFVSLLLGFAMLCRFVWAGPGDDLPVLRKEIDPNEGRPTAGVMFQAANVVLTVDHS
jgi:hypothetical protein